MPDGKRALIGLYDGVVNLWNIETDNEVARFIYFNDGEWVCLTKQGYFNASSRGAAHLVVRNPSGVLLMKGELLAEYFWPKAQPPSWPGDSCPPSARVSSLAPG